MSDANLSETDCNTNNNNHNNNKENEFQGNSEDVSMSRAINTMNIDNKDSEEDDGEEEESEEYDENDIVKTKEFSEKYDRLQENWLNGHREISDVTEEERKICGDDNAYILPYVDHSLKDVEKRIAFHPLYSYKYTNYDKEIVLPTLSRQQLIDTKNMFQAHIDNLEVNILEKLAVRQAEILEEEKKERERRKNSKNEDGEFKGWVVPEYSIPIRGDIRSFDFGKLALEQKRLSGRLFDAIMMDPPWQLATANPTRGVALGYSQLGDDIISGLPVHKLQENGLLFVWVINAKYRLALELFRRWGYKMVADIAWVKQTVNRRIANGHGFYLQHAKETCLIGLKGTLSKIPSLNNKKLKGIASDVIYSERRGQSQKPEEVYQYIEKLIPNGFYMEIFGRRNNLRNGWLTIGNEL